MFSNQNVGFLMKVKKSKNLDLWSAPSEVNQILAIQLFRKFCPVNFFFISFWAFLDFSHLLRPSLNQGCAKGLRSLAEAEAFWPSALASVAEGFRRKLLAKGLGCTFCRVLRHHRQSVHLFGSILHSFSLKVEKILIFFHKWIDEKKI